MPPARDAAEVSCLRFLNQIIKPTPTAAAGSTNTIATEALVVILCSPERRPGGGPALVLGPGSGPTLGLGLALVLGPGSGPTLGLGLALGVGLTLGVGRTLGLGPERNKQACSICSDVYTRWGLRAAMS